MTEEIEVLRTVVGITVLVFFAKVLGAFCNRLRVPQVIGEVLAGIVFGPLALGGHIFFLGKPLIELNDLMLAFSQIGCIIVLFSAGLEFTFADLRKAGVASFVTGLTGVVLPFLLGYQVMLLLKFDWTVAMLVGATLSATSIAITVRTLEDLGQHRTKEASIMINAAMVDDVLALAVLSVVTSVIFGGEIPTFSRFLTVTAKSMVIWLVMLVVAVVALPRIFDITAWALPSTKGTMEVLATTSCFGLAVLSAAFGLSPIVGAFAAGMAIAGSHVILQIKEYIDKFKIIFEPIFFAVIGTYFDLSQLFSIDAFLVVVVLIIALFSKIAGCGLPGMYFTRSRKQGLRIGLGMVSRGEVGFLVAGLGLASGVLEQDVYSAIILVIFGTTIISPILLRRSFGSDEPAKDRTEKTHTH